MLYGIDKEKQLREEDLILGTALAQQYLQDAEAAGSASPSHRSRRDTEGTTRTHGGHGGEVAEGHPQVPSLRHAASSDPGSEKRGLESEPPGSYRALSERLRDEEVEDDANEARHFVSARIRYPPPRYSVKTDAGVPAGAVLFLLGFLLLPLWWVGAVYPRSHDSDVARTWRKYNALMALLSLPLLGLILALGGWHAMHD
ncbi:hypothetical protein GGI04_000205 [Coemansia thaxteri]|uniref:Transmembrane protein n=1 Tax=Coemansia thaxteri TaxID=2663907 RepID=A0A9W8BGZ8_9FUNG|nr:hypothetical protein H4R26_000363 [Coemansia thaxteri]KAJ2009715.1 hypothetical protein GGI04_000205 [Coemansia thaxteri]KAJ2486316.1 hypothetical protein EV174_001187 [Coemansia sp. RSA 2320]